MRLLGVCGSLQARSANRQLLETASTLLPEGVELVRFEGLATLPHFNPDLETEGPLPAAEAWRAALRESDAVLITCPEYGHSLPGALKNAIDWVIGSGELERKVVAITAATVAPERGRRGLAALAGTLGAVSARLVGGEPIARGPGLEGELRALLAALVARAEELDPDAVDAASAPTP